jgi:hypothetical protein
MFLEGQHAGDNSFSRPLVKQTLPGIGYMMLCYEDDMLPLLLRLLKVICPEDGEINVSSCLSLSDNVNSVVPYLHLVPAQCQPNSCHQDSMNVGASVNPMRARGSKKAAEKMGGCGMGTCTFCTLFS